MKFGDYLRELREEKGWTQPEAALKAGIEQSYLSKLETGKSYPSEEVFARLAEAFGFASPDVVQMVTSAELNRLREIGEIRTAILDRQSKQRTVSRSWLAAMLVCLTLGGACLGLTGLAELREQEVFEYRSMGVLMPDESLNMFDLVTDNIIPVGPDFDAVRAARADLNMRIDVVIEETDVFRGPEYVESVEGGRRVFEVFNERETATRSPLRWFIVPALALLFGGLGCGIISFRWN